ncbi:hypothetical protein [Candidatus Microthrix parvicella]|uniref:hypothetical protein n=1 Tax=Candidatus Neomicrothrix parvicella TaxID=41950 RepID=UPI0004BCB573|nr:hypothetical protein [Candidatus Microthrix parvicella]
MALNTSSMGTKAVTDSAPIALMESSAMDVAANLLTHVDFSHTQDASCSDRRCIL